jgi:hypothetical protein
VRASNGEDADAANKVSSRQCVSLILCVDASCYA